MLQRVQAYTLIDADDAQRRLYDAPCRALRRRAVPLRRRGGALRRREREAMNAAAPRRDAACCYVRAEGREAPSELRHAAACAMPMSAPLMMIRHSSCSAFIFAIDYALRAPLMPPAQKSAVLSCHATPYDRDYYYEEILIFDIR